MTKKILLTIAAVFVVFGTLGYFNRGKIKEVFLESQKKSVPKAVSYQQAKKKIAFINGTIETVEIIPVEGSFKMPEKQDTKDNEKDLKIPDSYNLNIPFTPQAPFAVWDEVHKEACEETSVLMAARFINGEDILGPTDADKEIYKLVDWQKRYFGFWKDTDASQTAKILKNYYGFTKTEVKPVTKIEDIKKEIAQGNPIVVPMAGRMLGNPYYTPPGPYYHMLVIKGYTKDKIITNDPGTKRGENYSYKSDIFYNAIHDWNHGDVISGKKVMIVVKK